MSPAPPCDPSPWTQKTHLARTPGHDRVTSVPSCPYCTPGGTHIPRWVLALHATPHQGWGCRWGAPGAVPRSGHWFWGLASCRGQHSEDWCQLGLGNEQVTQAGHHCRVQGCVSCSPGGSVPVWGNGVPSGPWWGGDAVWGGLVGVSPSSPQSSGMAEEADARAAARNTITLPRPGMELRIWRRQRRWGESVTPCNGAAGMVQSPQDSCRAMDPASPSHLIPILLG